MGKIKLSPETKKQLTEQMRKMGEEMHKSTTENMRIIDVINKSAKKNKREPLDLPGIPGFINDSRLGRLLNSMGKSKMTSDEAVRDLSMLEFVIVNSYLIKLSDEAQDGFKVNYGGQSESGRLYFSNLINSSIYQGYWMNLSIDEFPEFNFIVQTLAFQDSYGRMNYQLSLISDDALPGKSVEVIRDDIFDMSFKRSEYVGKCLRVNVDEGRLNKIEIINTDSFKKKLILDETQTNFLNKFGDIVVGGGNARYLLNGTPGSGKTESIRNIIAEYTPAITFVQPEFTTSDDLMSIMESCEVFAPCVIIIDDIDLYLGSRDKGSYSNLLGKFLSYFDGVKKRNVSLLASTNDQSLVDSAAQRPGRFNMILDFGYLSQENIIEVCKLVLPKKFQVDEVYSVLSSNSKKITGAFLANLGENLKEFSTLDKKWTLEDTKALIETSYKGFYSSQINTKNKLGFHIRE